jgi:acyl-CoA synthetase (AMP-forming)/AMP-acid ligase II
MRQIMHNKYVPVAVDPSTGDLERNCATGFAIRQSYEVGGEMLVRIASESVFPGYWNDPIATAKKFERNVFAKGDLWYRTGDALRRTADGRWFFLDRLGDTYRWKSENVSTAEVSEVLGQYPGIVEASVYGVALPNHEGRAGCAAICLDPSHQRNFDFAGLHRFAQSKLPKYAVPVFIRLTTTMSHTHNNKQDKTVFKAEGVDPDKVHSDQILWSSGKTLGYVPFTYDDWNNVQGAQVRL